MFILIASFINRKGKIQYNNMNPNFLELNNFFVESVSMTEVHW